jgi:predicted anti-sigma-YlaC factor YlaD
MKKESKKMNCQLYRDRVEEYVEGKLGKEEALSFENHLESCPECAELVRVQKLADRIIGEEKSSTPGFYLSGKIMNRIVASEQERGSALIRFIRPAVITISIAAAIFSGVLIGNISSRPQVKAIPIELTLMNDIAIESVNVLTRE